MRRELASGSQEEPSEGGVRSPVEPDPYRELFERSADAILIIEGNRFVDCNQATVEMLRSPDKAHVLRTHPSELSPPMQSDGRGSYEKANEMIATAFERGSHRFEWDHVRFDGEVFPVEVLLTAVQRGQKEILHVVWRDITDRKHLEEQLRHSQKMEAIGQLAGGIAHDFNNLLIGILGYSELLRGRLGDEPTLLRFVREIDKAGSRAADLVRRLLTFSRKQEVRPVVIDLESVLEEVNTLLLRLIGEDVRLVTIPSEAELRIKATPGQIEQVIVNLATNARDAMPGGGTLTVESKRVTVGPGSIGTIDQLEPGDYAVIAVSDTGGGMSEEVQRQAIVPFFTTKGVGEGTGLGLSTVYGIAKQSGGTLSIHSTPGRGGTTVKAYFPLTGDEVREEIDGRQALSSRGGSERVLVAEDEEVVRGLVVDVLIQKGYRVELARDGQEALELIRRDAEGFDLLLSDVIMPRMSGPELVGCLRREGIEIGVLFMSGYTSNALAVLEEIDEEIDILEKPFSSSDLVGRIRLAIDSARGQGSTSESGELPGDRAV